jgi:hypothetical protein
MRFSQGQNLRQIIPVVVTGTVGAGKSSFIRSVSDIAPVDTDRKATDETALMKKKTTVAMDFGRLHLGNKISVHLYGTPGQSRFDFMWDILIRRAAAYILLVDAHRPSDFRYARKILSFMKQRVNIPLIIGLTHTDCKGAWSKDNVAIALGFVDEKRRPPIVILNPTQRQSVVQLLTILVQQVLQKAK